MASGPNKRASMREGPLAALFRKTEEGETETTGAAAPEPEVQPEPAAVAPPPPPAPEPVRDPAA